MRAITTNMGRTAAIGALVLAATVSCESTRTAVGGGLLASVADEATRHDTLSFALSDTSAVSWASYPVQISAASSRLLLVGEANDYRATTLIKFSKLEEWTEERDYYDGTEWQTETITITPYEIAGDSTELRLTFRGWATDPADVLLQGWRIPGDWVVADSVTQAMPADWFTGAPAFSGDSLVMGGDGSGTNTEISFIAIDSSAAATMLDDSLSFAIQALNPTTLAQIYSVESEVILPHLIVTYRATVKSSIEGVISQDSVITRTFIAARDTYRLERLAGPNTPAPDVVMLGSGAPRRGYFKLNRYDIPGMSTDGVPVETATANTAVLEVTLADRGNTFQSDSVRLELLELGEEYAYESARQGELSFLSTRLTQGVYFDTDEVRDTLDANTRRFEISDIVNRWWRDPEMNYGLLLTPGIEIREGDEFRRVDAAEVVDLRLLITTTLPPVIETKPARQEVGG